MKFSDRVKSAVAGWRGRPYYLQVNHSKLQNKNAPFVWPDFRSGSPSWRLIDIDAYIDEGFTINSLIYSAVMVKAKAASQAVMKAYSTDETGNPILLPDDDPLQMLVSNPNPYMGRRAFNMWQTVFFNIAGESYVWLDRRPGEEVPIAQYLLNPRRMYIVPNPTGGKSILGYLYVPEGKGFDDGIPMIPEDIVHSKLPNPNDPLDGLGYGLSPISSMARSADVDNIITEFLQIFFENGAIPAGVLSFETGLRDNDIARIKERWLEMYGGYKNWSEIGVLDQGGQYNRVGMNFEELGFASLDERNESRVLGPFGVPPIMIGSRLGLLRSTYSNYEEAREAFWKDTMIEELGLHEESYAMRLKTESGSYVKYDLSNIPALQDDRAEISSVYNAAWIAGAITKNEYRKMINLDPTDDGDVYLVSSGQMLLPLGSVPVGVSGDSPAGIGAGDDDDRDTDKAIRELAKEIKSARELLESTK